MIYYKSFILFWKYSIKYSKLQYKYGSYNKALLEIGLTVNRILSEEDETFIINQIKDLYKKIGHAPSLRELKDNNIRTGKILNKYKGIVNLYKEINIPLNSEISKKDFFSNSNLSFLFLSLNAPTIEEAKEYGINTRILIVYFKGWKNVCNSLHQYQEPIEKEAI